MQLRTPDRVVLLNCPSGVFATDQQIHIVAVNDTMSVLSQDY